MTLSKRATISPEVKRPAPPPLVSIVLAVYNGEATLAQALASIYEQTFTDYELLLINDGSSDRTADIAREWQTKWPSYRFTLLTQPTNQGLTPSLVAGVLTSRGTYIARLDADDVWRPTKLEQQVAFLEARPDYGLVGCWYSNRSKKTTVPIRLPTDDASIRTAIYQQNPFGHSCILVRRSALIAAGNYDSRIRFGQDYDLWFRLLPLTKVANIGDFLVERSHGKGISRENSPAQLRQSLSTLLKYLHRYQAPWWRYVGAVRVGIIYGLSLLKQKLTS